MLNAKDPVRIFFCPAGLFVDKDILLSGADGIGG